MIDSEKMKALRKHVAVWNRLIEPDATEALDTIDALLKVREVAMGIQDLALHPQLSDALAATEPWVHSQ